MRTSKEAAEMDARGRSELKEEAVMGERENCGVKETGKRKSVKGRSEHPAVERGGRESL